MQSKKQHVVLLLLVSADEWRERGISFATLRCHLHNCISFAAELLFKRTWHVSSLNQADSHVLYDGIIWQSLAPGSGNSSTSGMTLLWMRQAVRCMIFWSSSQGWNSDMLGLVFGFVLMVQVRSTSCCYLRCQ